MTEGDDILWGWTLSINSEHILRLSHLQHQENGVENNESHDEIFKGCWLHHAPQLVLVALPLLTQWKHFHWKLWLFHQFTWKVLLTTLETLVSKIPLCLLQNMPRIYFAVLSDCVDDVLYIFHLITSGMYLSRGLAFIAKSMHDFYKENVREM